MTADEIKKVAGLWAMYAAYYRMKLDDQVLKMYAEDLSDLPFESVRSALDAFRKNPKNRQLPMPSMIRDIIEPQVDPESAARDIASRITAAIPKFGYMRRAEAFAFIGPIGAQIVERYGGWQRVCEGLGEDLDYGMFTAQVRELAKAQLTHSPHAMAQAIGLTPGARAGEIQSIGEIMAHRNLINEPEAL